MNDAPRRGTWRTQGIERARERATARRKRGIGKGGEARAWRTTSEDERSPEEIKMKARVSHRAISVFERLRRERRTVGAFVDVRRSSALDDR